MLARYRPTPRHGKEILHMDRDLCVIDGLVSSWVAIDGAGVHGGGQELFITSTGSRQKSVHSIVFFLNTVKYRYLFRHFRRLRPG